MENRKEQFYSSPESKVMEIKPRQIICESNTERPTDETPGWEWTNE